MYTSAECRFKERRALVKFLRSFIVLLIKLLICWFCSFRACIKLNINAYYKNSKSKEWRDLIFVVSCDAPVCVNVCPINGSVFLDDRQDIYSSCPSGSLSYRCSIALNEIIHT